MSLTLSHAAETIWYFSDLLDFHIHFFDILPRDTARAEIARELQNTTAPIRKKVGENGEKWLIFDQNMV